MTDTTVANAPTPQRISQATSIEQTRAATEVQAAVVAARAVPRDVQTAMVEMRAACDRPALAERAFFRYNRGGQPITGPTIVLARELARIWGNIDYGIAELSRDDVGGESEMRATAWDMQANARSSSTFIVKHATDLTGGGRKNLTALRDVYENNANNGARRVREMIFAVMPAWFVDEAKDRCVATLRNPGDGLTLAQRVANLVEGYAANAGVRPEQLEAKVGAPASKWTDIDVAQLVIIAKSIARGEVTVAEEFPLATERVTAAQMAGPARVAAAPAPEATSAAEGTSPAATPPAPEPAAPAAEVPQSSPAAQDEPPASGPAAGDDLVDPSADQGDGPEPITRGQLTRLSILAKELGYDSKAAETRQEYLDAIEVLALRPVKSMTELTRSEAKWVMDAWSQKVEQLPKPEREQPQPDRPDTREARLDEYHLIVDKFVVSGRTEQDAIAALQKHYAKPVAELDLAQLQGYGQRLALDPVEQS